MTVSDTGPEALPPAVNEDEVIIRAVKSPFHLKRGRLLARAFAPPLGRIDVSVIRLLAGFDHCAEKARDVADQPDVSEYAGMALAHAAKLRAVPVDVEDDPEPFVGHANLVYREIAELLASRRKGEPLPPDEQSKLTSFYARVAGEFTFKEDPRPDGEPLEESDLQLT